MKLIGRPLLVMLTLSAAVPLGCVRGSESEPQISGYARPELLVDADWVAEHGSDPDVRIVDLRPRGYEAGHIPGAVHLANADIRVADRPPTFLPTVDEFETLMARLGISDDTRVVAYDARGGIYAARLWWILNYFGHSNVALLDGGWRTWAADQRPTTADVPPARNGRFTARPNTFWVATAQDVLDAVDDPGIKIVDARTVDEIEGRDLRGIRRGGAIPSSISVYWEDTFDPDTHLFKPAGDLRTLYQNSGVLPEHEVITYCQVGMRASHNLFVLRLLGYDKLRNYYGAWEEWGNRDDLPMKR